MEVVTATPTNGSGVPPFHDHDVREWSRIDSLTGALERARIETDHWSTSTLNSSHKYGKVVDSLSRTDPDGSLQHAARRQLEVFHSQVPGGRLQVVKTHAVSKWTSNGRVTEHNGGPDFENVQLSLNPLDLTPQKSKALILRSVSRRPPTRQRNKEPPPLDIDQLDPLSHAHRTAAVNLHRVSRLCHQIHESAVKQAFGRRSPRPKPAERPSTVEITEIENETNGHSNLVRTKSSSSEDINLLTEKDSKNKSIEDLEDLEQLQNWRRTSKLRRSLQFPKSNSKCLTPSKPIDLPESSISVKKIREELEKGRRLNTALRNNSVDLDALDQILQSISSTSSDKASDDIELESSSSRSKQKRNSFVTVESIQEVKGRLRRTSSPSSDIYKVNGKDEDPDDGIVTEDNYSDNKMSLVDKAQVRSYIYGMDNHLDKKPSLGTGSLESRVKMVNGNGTTKSEDWYNRRKSYGFEQVHNHEENHSSISLRRKNLVESSTDSGICRSTEMVVKRNGFSDELNSDNSDLDQKYGGVADTISSRGIQTGQVKKLANTFNQIEKISNGKSLNDSWSKFTKSDESWTNPNQELKSTKIHIPIVKNNNIIDLTWNDEPEKEIKRHSIAVDESKYVTNNNHENRFRRTSLALNDQFLRQDDDDTNGNRRPKKVEFCKTEVHFAAESGKVNIVATDEKPPPTQNFRRRRRNSGPTLEDFNKNGLPMLHFGDSTDEKSLFGTVSETNGSPNYENLPVKPALNYGLVTVNTTNNINTEITEEEETKNLTESEIKGILKNKPIKPRPYHLGETVLFSDSISDDDNKWGVKLRHVEIPDNPPIWKSTVTVHNYYDNRTVNSDNDQPQPEFQKLLQNLRPTKKSNYGSEEEERVFENERNDRINEKQKSEIVKGYSTKINFGEGQTTVVQNDRHPTWPRAENLTKDSKQLLNKGLVVRIGREDSALNHTVCSKMTTTQDTNNTTTTTKITIDLSPSPPSNTNNSEDNCFKYAKYEKRSQNTSFKSTSLILNTIKDKCQTKQKTADSEEIPKKLEALKKLYEDLHTENSDSDADKEVQFLMSNKVPESEDETNSVLSGSWSKMRAYKNITDHVSRVREARDSYQHKLRGTKFEKDYEKPIDTSFELPSTAKYSINTNLSPVPLKKPTPSNNTELKPTEKLSSPFLVGQNSNYKHSPNPRDSPTVNFKTAIDKKLQNKHSGESIVLRQPKKSEMTYFGVNISPKPVKKISQAIIRKEERLSDKKEYKKSPSPTRLKKIIEKPSSPIYENVRTNRYNSRDIDSSILDELTKAADQILQAVNDYTDEEDNLIQKKPLETISETKSWKKETTTKKNVTSTAKTKLKNTSSNSSIESLNRHKVTADKPSKTTTDRQKPKIDKNDNSSRANTKARRLQRASSREALLQSHGSSSEDLPAKVEVPVRKPRLVKKTKLTQISMSNGLEMKKSPTNSNKRSKKEDNNNTEERILGSLPEIRHKTAVSTIRSTSEKTARDSRIRHKNDSGKKKPVTQRREISNKTPNLSSSRPSDRDSSTRPTAVNKDTVTVQHRISTANIKKCSRSEGLRH